MLTWNLKVKETGKRPVGLQDLADEGASLLVAGTETSATTLAYATYYFLAFPEVRRRVLEELVTVESDENGRMALTKLEALPYFVRLEAMFENYGANMIRKVGFVKETLRCTHGVPGRLTRVVPRGGFYVTAIDDYIPAGCVVGISHMMIHNNPDIFEEPLAFKPERWIGPKGKELDHWLLAFSKGSRDCIGKK